jgi:hypothetical protein
MAAREPRVILEVGAIVAVWVVALFGCQPGAARRGADSPAEPVVSHERPIGSNDSVAAGERLPASVKSAGAGQASPDKVGPAAGHDPESLFENWPRPEFVLLLTGQQHGYIEPCGCTGLEHQKGGLARRHSLITQLTDRGWPVVPLDVGNQVRRTGRQAEIKLQITLAGLKTMGYRAVALGRDDLRLSVDELFAATAVEGEQGSPFVSANVAIVDRGFTPRSRIIELAGKKVGVTSVMGDQWLKEVNSGEIVREPAADALRPVVEELQQAGCDLYVLLAHAGLDESQALAEQFPLFDVVVTAGGQGDPLYQPQRVGQRRTMLVQVGNKGMHVGVVGYFTAGERLRYQRVPLDSRFPDSPEMLQLLASYQKQLQQQGLEGLAVQSLPHSSGRWFVGSERCGECHTKAYATWKDTPHGWATDSLVNPSERVEVPRHFDPECLSCHVTGWNPQRYFPYTSGFLSLEKTPLLVGNGCENCHGPGSEHVAAEMAAKAGSSDISESALSALRASMRLPLDRAEQHCQQCHDGDNSPDFFLEGAFDTYWQQIEHRGLD